jgi:L-fucose isomerase-like protein
MYIAAVRIAAEFGCSIIGIQYQLGLMDLLPASDFIEGLLNSADRPPVKDKDGKVLFSGKPLIHFNEVDEGAALDALLNNRVAEALGQPVETTLHDVRWGAEDPTGTVPGFVWLFMISGAVPPAHLEGGWKGSHAYRQSPMFFKKGGATLAGTGKKGEIVWSRLCVDNGELRLDLGRGRCVSLPKKEVQRRAGLTNPEWPVVSAVLDGVSRDQFMGRHPANHIQIVYAKSAEEADKLLAVKAAMADELGIKVYTCGLNNNPL